MTILCLYLATTPASAIAFDRIERAHADLSAASFTAEQRLTGLAQNLHTRYEMAYRWPSELRLRTIHPGTGKLFRERAIERTRSIDYDPELMQGIVAKRSSTEPLGKTLSELDKDLDDLLLAYTDPKGFGVWMTDMVAATGWRLTGASGKFSLTLKKGEKKILLEAGRNDCLLRKIDITTGPQRLVWDVKYKDSVGEISFRRPPGADLVAVFDTNMKPPKYGDDQARRVATKMFDTYEQLTSIGFTVERTSGSTKVQVRGKFVRQDDDAASWTYDGKTLTYHNKRTGKWFRGELGFTDVVDAVGGLGTRVDPTIRLLMLEFNPYRKRLGDGATVRHVGTMPLSGEEVAILESESDNALITLFVREDGLVAGSSVRAKQPMGAEDETVDLRYEYFDVPRDLSTLARLKVPANEKPQKLSPKPTA